MRKFKYWNCKRYISIESLKTFEKTNNIKIPFKYSCRRPGDLAYVVADNNYAKSEFKIFPKRTIQEICKIVGDGCN